MAPLKNASIAEDIGMYLLTTPMVPTISPEAISIAQDAAVPYLLNAFPPSVI
jgi:hypothetical protein